MRIIDYIVILAINIQTHAINVSFIVLFLQRQRGGFAPIIASTTHSLIMR